MCLYFSRLSIVLLILGHADGFLLPRDHCRIHFRAAATANRGDESLIIPVFPLRKLVRLPTERLTLNLYEDRYLGLAEFVLKSDSRLFGALYSSDKPQVVPKGMDNIVPMLQPGDVGVICVLEDSEEAHIPTQGAAPRRRIRLVGTGAGRFRIKKILHNGYGDDSLPFIIVEALRLNDKNCSLHESDLEEELCTKLIQTSRDKEGGFLRESDEKIESLTAKLDGKDLAEQWSEQNKKELRSFAIASALLSDGFSTERLEILRMQSTTDRLNLLEASLPKAWGFW